jgi:hypothetical protein
MFTFGFLQTKYEIANLYNTEIANLYNTSVYLSMQGIASTVTPLSNGTAPIRGPTLAKEVASVSVHCSVNEKRAQLKKKNTERRIVLFDSPQVLN